MHLAGIASAALISFALYTDAAVVPQDSGIVRLPLVRNGAGQLAQLKHMDSLPLDKRADTAPLYNALGREYMIEVGIGTPAQKFNLTLDTGSAELWVPSTECPVKTCPYGRFDPSKSATYEASIQAFAIEYGVGSANGTYGADTVTVGTAKVEKQKIALAKDTKNILGIVSSGEQSNGILGLGFPGLNSARGSSDDIPLPFNLAGKLADPVFSIFLNSHFSYGMSGEIMFGGIDAAKYTGTLSYVPVVSYDLSSYMVAPNVGANGKRAGEYLYWSVPGQGVKAGTYSKSLDSVQALILDTGTTLTMIPKTYAEGILNAVAGSSKYSWDVVNGVYRIDCTLASSSATVEFQISTATDSASTTPVTISTPMNQLIIPLDTDYLETAKSCMFGITQSSNSLTAGENWIIGEASLRSMYSVYDMKNNRVGLAPVNLDGAGKSSPASSTDSDKTSDTTSTTQQANDKKADKDDADSSSSKSEDESAAAARYVNLAAGAVASALASYWLM
ncbi:aspartic peptidase domain-containing protein [Fennellomyces sp. T-0311]|nr:aspartic peptidase domain-containing protein [Fennellomyces sp. T-0311]